jgi:hypothetical protein
MRYLGYVRFGMWVAVTAALIAFGVFFVDPEKDGTPPPAAPTADPS